MGGSGESAQSRQQKGFTTGYTYYQPGVDPRSIFGEQQSNLNYGAYQGWLQADADYKARQEESNGFLEMLMGMLGGMGGPAPIDYSQQYADQQAEYDRRAAEQARQAGMAETQNAYANYLNAAGSATDYINAEIDNERSNAALMGVDYNIDDATKQARIENYFATVWGEGDQVNLEGLIGQWGAPEGFSGFSIKRGDASAYKKPGGGKEKTVATSKGLRTMLDDEEEAQTGNLLGV